MLLDVTVMQTTQRNLNEAIDVYSMIGTSLLIPKCLLPAI